MECGPLNRTVTLRLPERRGIEVLNSTSSRPLSRDNTREEDQPYGYTAEVSENLKDLISVRINLCLMDEIRIGMNAIQESP